MGALEKTKFLEETLNEKIKLFGGRRKENKAEALLLKLSVTGLGAAVTVLLGLQGVGHATLLRDIALVLSAVVTLSNALDAFWTPRALWTRYTVTWTDLMRIRTQLNYLCLNGNDAPSESELDALFVRMQDVLAETDAWWRIERQKQLSAGSDVPPADR